MTAGAPQDGWAQNGLTGRTADSPHAAPRGNLSHKTGTTCIEAEYLEIEATARYTKQPDMRKCIVKRVMASVAALLLTTYAALADDMVVAHPGTVKWGDAPSVLPKGAQLAVITGDPGKTGAYVIRVKVPAGYQIPAHWHSTAENLTVLSGAVHVGMGAKLDKSTSTRLETGSFTYLPAKMNHFLWTSEPAVFQIHAEGPFDIVYVNPNDDPSKLPM